MDCFFHPWIGNQYFTGGIFGKKIMILGDSHYCGENCGECGKGNNCRCNEFTSMVVKAYLDQNNEREGWMSTYLKFERSLVNHETLPEESVKIWNSLLFYNYLQIAMNRPRQAGTQEQYRNAADSFFLILEQYKPDLLIVWGVRLWNNLPQKRWIDGEDLQVDGFSINNGYYMLSNGDKVRVICVYHPSVGYSWDYWYKVIMQQDVTLQSKN